jgi:hypothetical protein
MRPVWHKHLLPGAEPDRQEVRFKRTDDAPIYHKPYKWSKVERKMIQARTVELFGVGLVELASFDCEYASATVMPSKKDIYGN